MNYFITMILFAQELHRLIQNEIEFALKNNVQVRNQLNDCVEITNGYWDFLKQMVVGYTFQTAKEEIFFFKHVKPLFTSEIEYFRLLQRVEICNRPNKFLPGYLDLETERLEKFIIRNDEFYWYYKDNRTDLDQIYFVRANNRSNHPDPSRPYDKEKKVRTSHDYLVAAILSLEKYDMYLNNLFKMKQ